MDVGPIALPRTPEHSLTPSPVAVHLISHIGSVGQAQTKAERHGTARHGGSAVGPKGNTNSPSSLITEFSGTGSSSLSSETKDPMKKLMR